MTNVCVNSPLDVDGNGHLGLGLSANSGCAPQTLVVEGAAGSATLRAGAFRMPQLSASMNNGQYQTGPGAGGYPLELQQVVTNAGNEQGVLSLEGGDQIVSSCTGLFLVTATVVMSGSGGSITYAEMSLRRDASGGIFQQRLQPAIAQANGRVDMLLTLAIELMAGDGVGIYLDSTSNTGINVTSEQQLTVVMLCPYE